MFPCSSADADTAISCLSTLFSLFGLPAYVHSDRGSAFMSANFQSYLLSLGVASICTTPYIPRSNSQCEQHNGLVWRTILLALRSKNLPVAQWKSVVGIAIHSVRSLISTSTNDTPHDRMFNFSGRASNGSSVPTW